jgi:hypothetical protein
VLSVRFASQRRENDDISPEYTVGATTTLPSNVTGAVVYNKISNVSPVGNVLSNDIPDAVSCILV